MLKIHEWSMILILSLSAISPLRKGFVFMKLLIRENKTSPKFLSYQLSKFEGCSGYNLYAILHTMFAWRMDEDKSHQYSLALLHTTYLSIKTCDGTDRISAGVKALPSLVKTEVSIWYVHGGDGPVARRCFINI